MSFELSMRSRGLRANRDVMRELRRRGQLDHPAGDAAWRHAQGAFLLANTDDVVDYQARRRAARAAA